VLVRTELDNQGGRLKPSMLASMLIEAAPVQRLVVPSAGVVREDDIDYVFVQEANGMFRLTKVRLGPERGGQRVVMEGIKQGARVVIEGAFHLNNQRNLKAMESGN
jgi:cobalt-zinc-cadmium efflux system membrane fusion protein